ncbi:hypothetical protein CVT26_002853, partial [Gymnopilus dilepis]
MSNVVLSPSELARIVAALSGAPGEDVVDEFERAAIALKLQGALNSAQSTSGPWGIPSATLSFPAASPHLPPASLQTRGSNPGMAMPFSADLRSSGFDFRPNNTFGLSIDFGCAKSSSSRSDHPVAFPDLSSSSFPVRSGTPKPLPTLRDAGSSLPCSSIIQPGQCGVYSFNMVTNDPLIAAQTYPPHLLMPSSSNSGDPAPCVDPRDLTSPMRPLQRIDCQPSSHGFSAFDEDQEENGAMEEVIIPPAPRLHAPDPSAAGPAHASFDMDWNSDEHHDDPMGDNDLGDSEDDDNGDNGDNGDNDGGGADRQRRGS